MEIQILQNQVLQIQILQSQVEQRQVRGWWLRRLSAGRRVSGLILFVTVAWKSASYKGITKLSPYEYCRRS